MEKMLPLQQIIARDIEVCMYVWAIRVFVREADFHSLYVVRGC